uniref:Bifunctional protein FolD n=1 Tax=Lygus hesperus TaxID=30085 RepID=A0A0A9XE74_LYGHE
MGHITQCLAILFAAAVAVSAQNNSCLAYLATCSAGSTNCCNYPIVLCLPDTNNGTSCLNLFDIVNINPEVTGFNLVQPFLKNATGFLSESISINGKNVYNTTERFTQPPTSQ